MTTVEASGSAVGVALALGTLAKGWDKFPDRLIPTLCCVVGVVLVPALAGWTVDNAVTGFMAGYSATGINQQFRQIRQRTGNTEIIKKDQP
jgi:hypothetical protein